MINGAFETKLFLYLTAGADKHRLSLQLFAGTNLNCNPNSVANIRTPNKAATPSLPGL